MNPIQFNSFQFNSNFIKIAKYILAHLIQNVYKHYNIPIHKSVESNGVFF